MGFTEEHSAVVAELEFMLEGNAQWNKTLESPDFLKNFTKRDWEQGYLRGLKQAAEQLDRQLKDRIKSIQGMVNAMKPEIENPMVLPEEVKVSRVKYTRAQREARQEELTENYLGHIWTKTGSVPDFEETVENLDLDYDVVERVYDEFLATHEVEEKKAM